MIVVTPWCFAHMIKDRMIKDDGVLYRFWLSTGDCLHLQNTRRLQKLQSFCYLELSSARLFQFHRLIIDGTVTGSELLMLSWDLVVLELRNRPDCRNTGVNILRGNSLFDRFTYLELNAFIIKWLNDAKMLHVPPQPLPFKVLLVYYVSHISNVFWILKICPKNEFILTEINQCTVLLRHLQLVW